MSERLRRQLHWLYEAIVGGEGEGASERRDSGFGAHRGMRRVLEHENNNRALPNTEVLPNGVRCDGVRGDFYTKAKSAF